jgi:hypothetical protein
MTGVVELCAVKVLLIYPQQHDLFVPRDELRLLQIPGCNVKRTVPNDLGLSVQRQHARGNRSTVFVRQQQIHDTGIIDCDWHRLCRLKIAVRRADQLCAAPARRVRPHALGRPTAYRIGKQQQRQWDEDQKPAQDERAAGWQHFFHHVRFYGMRGTPAPSNIVSMAAHDHSLL